MAMTTEYAQMKQLFDSMENGIRLRARAKAERRAQEAEQEERKFREKLLQAAATDTELDSIASSAKGKDDAGLRDQLMGLMGIY